MKQFWMRVLPCICLVLLLTFFFPLFSFSASAASNLPTVNYSVTIVGSGDVDTVYVENWLVSANAVDYQPWSIRVAPGGNGLIFSYSVPAVGAGDVQSASSGWAYDGNLDIVEFVVVSGSVTKTFAVGQIASADMFATVPYRYGKLPSSVHIVLRAERELDFWDKVESALSSMLSWFSENNITGPMSLISTLLGDVIDFLTVGSGDTSVDSGQLEDFEQGYLDRVEGGLDDITGDVDVGFLSPTFLFIGSRVSSVYAGMGDFRVVYILPIFIGILFVLTRYNPRSFGIEKPKEPEVRIHQHTHHHYLNGKREKGG